MTDAGNPSAVLRRERARRAVARLSDEVGRWAAGWAGASAQTSQLQLVGATLALLLENLAVRAGQIDPAAGFAAARAVDGDLAVVERLWRYLAVRFDQRRDPALAPTLAAADDIIWACTAEARALVGSKAAVMPLPLAYLEPAFSPAAIPRTEPPIDLEAADRALARILAALPVPLIGLPTSVVAEPWWLVLIAHEVGHHVQYDLEADDALIERTGEVLAAAGGDEGARWRGWSREVFADAVAVATAGPAAIQATVELEWDDAAAMVAERGAYPPVLVRVAFMIEVAQALKLKIEPELPRLIEVPAAIAASDDGARALAWLARVPAAAAQLVAMPVGTSSLVALAARFAGDDTWLERALAGRGGRPTAHRTRPLRAVAAALRAYRGLATLADGQLEPRRAALRERTMALLAEVRDPGDTMRSGAAGADVAAAARRAVAGLEALLPGLARRP